MVNYRYRLTITFSSAKQWKIGVETTAIGEDVARELANNAGDVHHICLSHEQTGEVIWLRRGTKFSN